MINLCNLGYVDGDDDEQCDELVEYGASVCETPAEVIKKCKYTIAMLSDPSAALSVFESFCFFYVFFLAYMMI